MDLPITLKTAKPVTFFSSRIQCKVHGVVLAAVPAGVIPEGWKSDPKAKPYDRETYVVLTTRSGDPVDGLTSGIGDYWMDEGDIVRAFGEAVVGGVDGRGEVFDGLSTDPMYESLNLWVFGSQAAQEDALGI